MFADDIQREIALIDENSKCIEMLSEENQNPLFSEDLKLPLKEYLGFRHVFRHSYGYKLDWERMKALFYNEGEIWQKAKSQIENFCKKYSN